MIIFLLTINTFTYIAFQKKICGGHHHNCVPSVPTLLQVTAAVVAILLMSCTCAANAEPVAPVQVATAVATATGTGEVPALPVEKPVEAVDPSPVEAAFSQSPQSQEIVTESVQESTTQAVVSENGDGQNKVSLTLRARRNDEQVNRLRVF